MGRASETGLHRESDAAVSAAFGPLGAGNRKGTLSAAGNSTSAQQPTGSLCARGVRICRESDLSVEGCAARVITRAGVQSSRIATPSFA